MNLPKVLNNILIERYSSANLEKKKQDISPLMGRNTLPERIPYVGADPDIERGQFNISDPSLPAYYEPENNEDDFSFTPVWVPPPNYGRSPTLIPPAEPPLPPSRIRPPNPPRNPNRENLRRAFTERGLGSPISSKNLENIMGRGPKIDAPLLQWAISGGERGPGNPNVLARIGPLPEPRDFEYVDRVNPNNGKIERLVQPSPSPARQTLRYLKDIGKSLPGAFIGSAAADYAVDEYGLPLLPSGWEKEQLNWFEPSSRTAYEMIGADVGAATGVGLMATARTLGLGASLPAATGAGVAAGTGLLASPIGIAITAAPAIYTSAKYLLTPESEELNAIYREDKRETDRLKIEQAREKQKQQFIDDLYRRYTEEAKNKK